MSAESSRTIELSHPGDNRHIAQLTIKNEKASNCLTMGMLNQLVDSGSELQQARAVILTAEGRHFCAGADIKEWGAMTPREFAQDWVRSGISAFQSLQNLPGIVIAAINGTCLGGGLELAMHCDVRIGAQSASFAMPETSIGITPGWNGGPMLARLAGKEIASKMILAGEKLDADQALNAGIISEVVADSQLVERALELAQHASERAPMANAAAKKLIASWFDNEHEISEKHVIAALEARNAKECEEGLAAFSQKRKPKY